MRLQTKEDYRKLFLEIAKPLKGKFTEGRTGIRLSGAGASYSQKVIELEGFARLLWGLVPFWAGGGREKDFEEMYLQGLAAGTDPEGDEYWGECEDYDQRFVEMVPIALGLLMAPEILWDPLSEKQKDNAASWLGQINSHELPVCNWYYFRVLVNLALRQRGGPYKESLMESDLQQIEKWYLGSGWYVDGQSRQKDYYSAFAMEFYSQLYAVLGEKKDSARCARFKGQAKEFAGEYIYWFDGTGAALPYGRSLIYRFGQAAFWAGALFSGSCAFSPGVAKGIINRNLRYWLSGEIFRPDKTLNVGYRYENLTMAERYNSPSSPYWALKTFLLLALPDDHPYWKAGEKPLLALEPVFSIPKAHMLIGHEPDHACAYVPGVYNKNVLGHFVEKYGKFVYSTVFGFSVSHSPENLEEAAPDSMLAFLFDEGREGLEEKEPRVYVRRRSIDYKVESDRIWSKWSPAGGVLVETEIHLIPNGHIRRHAIRTDKTCRIYDCGFAVACFEEGYETDRGDNWIQAENGFQHCRITGREGSLKPWLIHAYPNTNVLYKNTVIPALFKELEPGETVVETMVEGERNK